MAVDLDTEKYRAAENILNHYGRTSIYYRHNGESISCNICVLEEAMNENSGNQSVIVARFNTALFRNEDIDNPLTGERFRIVDDGLSYMVDNTIFNSGFLTKVTIEPWQSTTTTSSSSSSSISTLSTTTISTTTTTTPPPIP